MAIRRSPSDAPVVFTGTRSPNTDMVRPYKIGDLFIDTSSKVLYFAFGLSGTQWGTCLVATSGSSGASRSSGTSGSSGSSHV